MRVIHMGREKMCLPSDKKIKSYRAHILTHGYEVSKKYDIVCIKCNIVDMF